MTEWGTTMKFLDSEMIVYGAMCPVCGTMTFRDSLEEMKGSVACDLCRKHFEPQEIISGYMTEQLAMQTTAA